MKSRSAALAGLRAKALVALWEALPANASHDGAFDFPDASRSLFDAVAEMIGLMPMVRELEARLAADVEFRVVARSIAKMRFQAGNRSSNAKVSAAGIRLDLPKSVRPFKGIFCNDVSEFESHMPSQAVRSPSAT